MLISDYLSTAANVKDYNSSIKELSIKTPNLCTIFSHSLILEMLSTYNVVDYKNYIIVSMHHLQTYIFKRNGVR